MKPFLLQLLDRAGNLSDVQPVSALFLGGALLAVFLSSLLSRPSPAAGPPHAGLHWTLYTQLTRLLWAAVLLVFVTSALTLLRGYLHQSVANFQHSHGRVTEANLHAVETIWGAPQVQNELQMEIYYDEEVVERTEFDDVTRPAVLRKKMVRRTVTSNPFIFAKHDVTLRQNPRKKGSALYGGYETVCRFVWRLRNPDYREYKANLTFPLPAAGAMYDGLSATLNGADVLPQMQIKDGTLILARDLQPAEVLDFAITFESRGMSSWYFQVREPREIRDFTLALNLPDLPRTRLNYPEGCMTPTTTRETPDGRGALLSYRLDHAISSKGMGVALPNLPQPGATTNAVLAQVERGWLLIFAILTLGLTLAAVRHAALISILFATAAAFGYGLLGDFSDLLFGFWGTAAMVLVPLFVLLAWLLTRVVRNGAGKWLALQLLLFGIIYPCLAGIDSDRQTLYLNLCGMVFLSLAASQLVRKLNEQSSIPAT